MAAATKTIVAIEFPYVIEAAHVKRLAEHIREEMKKDQPVLIIPEGGRLVAVPVHYGSE